MKIVYLILAHSDPPQLGRLVRALDGGHASFLIHIDKKVDIRPFVIELKDGKNTQFIERRTKVYHGGFSQVQATLDLMHQAQTDGTRFDRLVLLSGLDYPIKDNQFIVEYFAQHKEREFIRYTNIVEEPFLEYKIGTMYFHDYPTIHFFIRALHRMDRMAGLSVFGKLLPLLLRRRYLDGFIPYFGSQWWALTQDCAEYILRFSDEQREFVNFYRFTLTPGELFFQTIIMNSDFAVKTNQRVELAHWDSRDRPVKEAGDKIKYMDWSLDRGWPAVLDERDFEALQKSDCLFARKFTTTRSLKLIGQIDTHLL